MNTLKYGTYAVGSPDSLKRLEAERDDILKGIEWKKESINSLQEEVFKLTFELANKQMEIEIKSLTLNLKCAKSKK